jgi:hypothetical protein
MRSILAGALAVAVTLNQRFDNGLRSKSESIAEPFKKAYFEVANDLFNAKLKPLIEDIDGRARSRIADLRMLVADAEKAIDLSIDAAEKAANKTINEIAAIEDKTKHDIDDILRQVDAIIDSADCAAEKTVDEIRRLIEIDLVPFHTDPCYIDQGYRFGSPGFNEDIPRYRIRQCQLERILQNSSTVAKVLDNLSSLSQLAHQTACILRRTTGSALASDDAHRYGEQFSVWYLTTAK